MQVHWVSRCHWIAPWPLPSTWGEPSAIRLRITPPAAGRSQAGSLVARSRRSIQVALFMVRMPSPAAAMPSNPNSR